VPCVFVSVSVLYIVLLLVSDAATHSLYTEREREPTQSLQQLAAMGAKVEKLVPKMVAREEHADPITAGPALCLLQPHPYLI